jgi:hypothetical protein
MTNFGHLHHPHHNISRARWHHMIPSIFSGWHYLLGPVASLGGSFYRWKNTQTLPESFQIFKIQFREFPSSHTTSYSGSNRIFSHRSSCKIHIQICWIHATFMQIASNCPPFVDSLASVRSELFSNSDAKNNMPNLQRDSDLLFLFFGRCKAHQNCALCAQHHDYFSTTNSSNSDCEARLGLGTTYKGRSQKSALCQKPGHHDSNESPTKAHPRHHHH